MAVLLERLVGCLHRWADPLRHAGPTDRQLLQQFAAERDEDAFAELVRRHGPMVLAVARRVLRDAHDAEDVSQSVFLVLARKAASVRWHESVGGWLLPVVYHLALKVRGGRQRRRFHEGQVEALGTALPIAERSRELREVLDQELGRLPDHYRNVLVLCYLEGRTQKEAAEQLGLSPNEVRGRLERARLLLHHRLTRRGLALGAATVAALTVPQGLPAATAQMIETTTRAAVHAVALSRTLALATGVLHAMQSIKGKSLILAALVLGALAAVVLSLPGPVLGDDPTRPTVARADKGPKPDARKDTRHLIVLWMSGGPSQIDTFDPKPGDANGGPLKAIDTNVKGIQISELLPKLAKHADKLAIIRSMTHDDRSHMNSSILMRTGRPAAGTDYPPLTGLLAAELSGGKLDLPPHVRIGGIGDRLGFLPAEFAPLVVSDAGEKDGPTLPALEKFEGLNKDKAETMRKGVEKAFDLSAEKKAVRDAYGDNAFGKGCLLARRLIEHGVPVVEVALGGWDSHSNNVDVVGKQCSKLDPAFAALLGDLKDRKLLDRTVIVWMGEFGRTPKINANDGRDHWSQGFSVVLAGGGVKGGQVIGKTSADGTAIDEHPVTPAELHATICRALGINPAKEIKLKNGDTLPLVEGGTKEVKEALK
jgi:RNA polymerase sigma factor (sigma-70 family)